jgi:single-strand DNA-binding protein
MMFSFTAIHGYLGRDPELHEYQNRKGEDGKLCAFSVSVKQDVGDETDWYECVAFGKRAEVIEKSFHKGSQILVWRRMRSERYEAKDGTNRIRWKLTVNGFDFCDKKSEGPIPNFTDVSDEDIPF